MPSVSSLFVLLDRHKCKYTEFSLFDELSRENRFTIDPKISLNDRLNVRVDAKTCSDYCEGAPIVQM